MHFRIQDFPELAPFPPEERQALIQKTVPLRTWTWLVCLTFLRSFCLALFCVLILTSTLASVGDSIPSLANATQSTAVMLTAMGLLWLVMFLTSLPWFWLRAMKNIRRQLQDYLRTDAASLGVCGACGYWHNLPADQPCSECGHANAKTVHGQQADAPLP